MSNILHSLVFSAGFQANGLKILCTDGVVQKYWKYCHHLLEYNNHTKFVQNLNMNLAFNTIVLMLTEFKLSLPPDRINTSYHIVLNYLCDHKFSI